MGDKAGDKSPEKQQQRTGKGFTFEVVLLDGEHINIELDRNAEGRELFEKVCQHLDLIEKDYFGLQYTDERIANHLKCWLSPDKKVAKQKKKGPWQFEFALKFYPPDPTQLKESLTRWLVTLQTRRDVLSGKLPATFLTQAMLGSYCVQADVGDYNPSEHRGIDYIRDTPFAPNQTSDLLEKIVELHKQHKGQTPDEAENNFLENAKKLAMYGVDLHAAQDVDNVDLMLGVCASGLQVYRDKLRISRFVWPRILKISYKRKHFYIKVRPSDNSPSESTVCFKLASHRLAKRLWKVCVEHHAFFRLREAEQAHNAAMFPRLGSKFRYSGRTLYQTRQTSQILDRPDPYFERSQPARGTFAGHTKSPDELSNHPDWRDDTAIGSKRPSESLDERDKRDQKKDPNATAELGSREGMGRLGSEDGALLHPGADQSMDGKDRRDLLPGEDEATLNKEGMQGTMGLTPAELQKKAKEDEKERKKREKEEEKRRKKEEEERKKAEKAAKKGKGKDKGGTDPTAEDRMDLKEGGDNTENYPGRVPGSYGDQEGGPMRFEMVAPVGAQASDGKGRDRDKDSSGRGRDGADKHDEKSPDKDGIERSKALWGPHYAADPEGRDRYASGRDGDKDRYGSGRDGDKDGDKDRYGSGRDGNKDRYGSDRDGDKDRYGSDRDGDKVRYGSGRDDDKDRYGSGRDGDKDRYGSGRDGDKDRYGSDRDGDKDRYGSDRDGDKDRCGSDRDGDKDRYGSDRDGDKDRYGSGRDGDRDCQGPDRDADEGGRGPGRDAADRTHFSPEEEGVEVGGRWAPGGIRLGSGREEKEPSKRGRKDSDKDKEDKDKKGKKGSKKDRKGSDKDEDKDAKGVDKDRKDKDADKHAKDKKGKKGSKDRKDSDKDDDKDGKDKEKDGAKDKAADKHEKDKKGKKGSKDRKGSDKDEDKDGKAKGKEKDADKHEKDKKGGGLFGKFKKPKESKSKLAEEAETGYAPGIQGPSESLDFPDAATDIQQGSAYPGFGSGLGAGAGDMSGVVGDETWIDNKMTFEPIVPPKKESKDSLKLGLDGIDRTMPFFSPAATSTVGRPGKVPPPVPPKANSFDDSYSRTDVPPTVATESVQYQPDLEEVPVPTKNVPVVQTQTRTVTYERQGFPLDCEDDDLVLVSARSHSTRMQTIETTTFTAERDGIQETRVEHKVVLPSTDDDEFDYDAALADAIRSVTEFNPDMSVERIECVQQIEEVKGK